MSEHKAVALTACIVALKANGSLTIMESQQEHEGESGAVTPAKSIWLNKYHVDILRNFLNEHFPEG